MTEREEQLVVVRRCGTVHEAMLLRSILMGVGIKAFAPDEMRST